MSTASFVDQLYVNFLGRSADANGKAHWTGQIDSGTLSAAQVSNSFLQSPEFSGVVTPLALLYFTAMARIPDAQGLSYWVQQLQSGVSMKDIATSFVNSSEFQLKYAGQDNSTFLEHLYQNVFNRAADSGGKAYWLSKMANVRIPTQAGQ